MLTGLIIFVHVIACIMLATLILVQSGKGGGLTEQFAPAGEMFGTQTSGFLVKGTTIFATVFLFTCLGLALVSAKKNESLMANKVAPVSATKNDAAVQKAVGDVKDAETKAENSAEQATEDVKQEADKATEAAQEAAPIQPTSVK